LLSFRCTRTILFYTIDSDERDAAKVSKKEEWCQAHENIKERQEDRIIFIYSTKVEDSKKVRSKEIDRNRNRNRDKELDWDRHTEEEEKKTKKKDEEINRD
jgi:hypothetical protein